MSDSLQSKSMASLFAQHRYFEGFQYFSTSNCLHIHLCIKIWTSSLFADFPVYGLSDSYNGPGIPKIKMYCTHDTSAYTLMLYLII